MTEADPKFDEYDEETAEAETPSASVPAFLILGRVLRPHGVRGELRLEIITDYPERVAGLETVYLGPDAYDRTTAVAYGIVGARRHREYLLVTLETITTREDADQLRGLYLMVSRENAVPLEEGEYYLYQIIGVKAYTTTGEYLGTVEQVIETGANDVLVLRGGPLGEVLIPDVPHVVTEIDIDGGTLTVEPLPGLLPQ